MSYKRNLGLFVLFLITFASIDFAMTLARVNDFAAVVSYSIGVTILFAIETK